MADVVQHVLSAIADAEAENLRSIEVEKPVELEFDLGNLLAVDSNDLDLKALRSDRENYLKNVARDNTQLLVNKIFQLPTQRVEDVIVAKLPQPALVLPREKPVPKPKPPSKWEQYAKEKGIVKRNKANLIWDEELKKWVPRYGYLKAKAEKEKNWVVEVSDKSGADPRMKLKTDKEERKAKNELQRLRNIAKGMKKSKSQVALEPTEKPSLDQLNRSVFVAHTATASLGKFQPNLRDQKPVLKSGQKRKFQPLVGDSKSERQKNLDILDKISKNQPRLDLEKAVNRELQNASFEDGPKKKKSKSSIKKAAGKIKHKNNIRGPTKKGGKSSMKD